MQRPLPSLAALATLALAAACTKPAPQQAAGVQSGVIVLYNQPKDTAAFEKYYAEKHVPLFASHAQEIGVTRVELVKFAATIDGQRPTLYRMADLRWASRAALVQGIATAGLNAVAADPANVATGGGAVGIGRKGDPGPGRARPS